MHFSPIVIDLAQDCTSLRKTYHETLLKKTALAAKLARKPSDAHRKALRAMEQELNEIQNRVMTLHTAISEELGLRQGSLIMVNENSKELFEYRSLEIGDINGTTVLHLKGVLTGNNIERVFTYMNHGNTQFEVLSYA